MPDKCFGNVSGPNWSDWYARNGGWSPRLVGVSGYSVSDGDMEGWTYTSGYGTPPPPVRFSQVCASPTPPPASATHAAQTSAAPILPARTPQQTASPPSSASPSIEALAPSPSPTAHMALASTGPPRSPPAGHDQRSLLLLAIGLVFLGALAAWNLATGRGP